MPINVHDYRGRPVPYFEFSDQELRHAIRSAKESIEQLEVKGCETSLRSIRILNRNLSVMRRVLGGAS